MTCEYKGPTIQSDLLKSRNGMKTSVVLVKVSSHQDPPTNKHLGHEGWRPEFK